MGRWTVLATAMAFAIAGCTNAEQEPDTEQEPAQSAETTDTDQDSEAGAESLSKIEETAASICEAVADRPEETVYERRITLGVRNGHNEQELRSAVADECGDIIAAIEDPEPEVDVLDQRDQQVIFLLTLDPERDSIAEALESSRDVETVDRIEFEMDSEFAADDDSEGVLYLAVTSGWASDDRQRDAAWGVVRSITRFWTNDFWGDFERVPPWWPVLDLTVDDQRYICDGETMHDLASRRLDRSGWEAACN